MTETLEDLIAESLANGWQCELTCYVKPGMVPQFKATIMRDGLPVDQVVGGGWREIQAFPYRETFSQYFEGRGATPGIAMRDGLDKMARAAANTKTSAA